MFNGYDWLVFPGVKLSNGILCSLKVVGNCNQWICPSLGTRPLKNRKGRSGKRGRVKVYTVECGTHIRMLIKNQSEVHLHTGCSVHFHPSWFTRPSFSILWGLVPRLNRSLLATAFGLLLQMRRWPVEIYSSLCQSTTSLLSICHWTSVMRFYKLDWVVLCQRETILSASQKSFLT